MPKFTKIAGIGRLNEKIQISAQDKCNVVVFEKGIRGRVMLLSIEKDEKVLR